MTNRDAILKLIDILLADELIDDTRYKIEDLAQEIMDDQS